MSAGDGNNRHTNRRSFLKATGAGASVGLAGFVGGATAQPDTFKVGAVYPLSGAVAETGQNIRKFVRNAANEVVNKQQDGLDPLALAGGKGLPNLGNATVEVTFADHRGDPAQGRAAANRLVQSENVDMLVGAYHSSVTKTVSQVAERRQIPHVNFESSSPDLTERGLKWFWRTGPHDRTYTQNMFQFFNGLNEQQDAGIESVGIIHEDTEFGSVSAQTQQQLADEHGYEVAVGPIAYTAESVTSLSSEVQRIQQADPDVLLPSSYLRDAQILMQDMQTLGYYPPMIMAQDAGFNQPSFKKKKQLSDYVCSRSTYVGDLTEAVPEIGTYNEFVNGNVGMGFNGVYIRSWGGFITAMHAVNEAGSADPSAIRSTLNSLAVEKFVSGLPFGVKFNDEHQNELATGMLLQYRDGQGRTIWPFDLAQSEVSYPAPGWNER